MDWIPLDQCKVGYLYLIHARNSHLGIFVGTHEGHPGSFTISRYKCTANYLCDEYHWDTGAPFGTVKPLKELRRAPEFKQKTCTCKSDEYRRCPACRKVDRNKLNWLNRMAKKYGKNP